MSSQSSSNFRSIQARSPKCSTASKAAPTHVRYSPGGEMPGVVAREVEREARQAGAGRREEGRHLALGHRDHGLLGGDPVAEPAGAVAVLAQQLDPLQQVPGEHAFVEEAGQVPDRAR